MTDYDRAVDLAAKAMLAAGVKPNFAKLARDHVFQAIALRGGVTADGRHIVKDVMTEVIAEVVQRAMRHVRNELVQRVRIFMDEDDIEALERELSASLAHVLTAVRSR